MTDRELLQMALDALEDVADDAEESHKTVSAIEAIRARLAQPEPVATGFIRTLVEVGEDGIETWKNEPFYTAPPQREPEPVAFLADATRFKVTLTQDDCKITNLPRELGGRWVALVAAENDCHMKLTAPPQREWVGLTQKEISEITFLCQSENNSFFAYAVEDKLREKNG